MFLLHHKTLDMRNFKEKIYFGLFGRVLSYVCLSCDEIVMSGGEWYTRCYCRDRKVEMEEYVLFNSMSLSGLIPFGKSET